MKIFTASQIKIIDSYTIENEPVKSVDLMERAAGSILNWLAGKFKKPSHFIIFAGPGNNGGDGLALGRLLNEYDFSVEIHYIKFSEKVSLEWSVNFNRLEEIRNIPFNVINSPDQFPSICANDIIIDAIFGSGLTRPADGLASEVIKRINLSGSMVISIDIPSGLFSEDNSTNDAENIIRADHTLSFQFPKLAFMFPENYRYTGEWHIRDIRLNQDIIRHSDSSFFYMESKDIVPLLRKRSKFDHKGISGHGLLIAGSSGRFGASVLSARAALRTGIGLLTCHVPSDGAAVINNSVAEAMTSIDQDNGFVSSLPELNHYSAVAVGPGLGMESVTKDAMKDLLTRIKVPLVIDADAINLLGSDRSLLNLIPPGSVLTPHPKEFERIAGQSTDNYTRLLKQIEFSGKHNCVVVLKGANTSISLPDGRVFFNSTGNPGMATAGSGDVLTGILLSLLSQGYSAESASLTGVFLHGLAGDVAAEKSGFESLIASDIIDSIGEAYKRIWESGDIYK